MPNDLNFNQTTNKGDDTGGSQITPNKSQSPLEESNPPAPSVSSASEPEVHKLEKLEPTLSTPESADTSEPEKPESDIPEAPATPEPLSSSSPSSPSSSQADGEGSETAKAPDTDEFLRSILDEKPDVQASTPEGPNAGASEESAAADQAVDQSEPPAPSAPLPISDESALDGNREQAPKIKDEISGLDQITGPSDESEADDNGSSKTKTIASDIFSAVTKPAASKSNSLRLVILVLIALVVAIGGYILFTKFFGKFSSKNQTSTTSVFTPSAEDTTTAKVSLDDQRKSDLHAIQEALINYFAAQTKYPVSEKLVLLNTPGNILEKELVPTYINKLPVDPVSTKSYGYKSDGKTFTLTAVLDNANDPDVTLEGGLPLFKVTPSTVFEDTKSVTSTTGVSSSSDAEDAKESTTSTTNDESPIF